MYGFTARYHTFLKKSVVWQVRSLPAAVRCQKWPPVQLESLARVNLRSRLNLVVWDCVQAAISGLSATDKGEQSSIPRTQEAS